MNCPKGTGRCWRDPVRSSGPVLFGKRRTWRIQVFVCPEIHGAAAETEAGERGAPPTGHRLPLRGHPRPEGPPAARVCCRRTATAGWTGLEMVNSAPFRELPGGGVERVWLLFSTSSQRGTPRALCPSAVHGTRLGQKQQRGTDLPSQEPRSLHLRVRVPGVACGCDETVVVPMTSGSILKSLRVHWARAGVEL